jgi:hypothetical protein
MAIKKEAFYTGTADEELASINFFGLDDVGDEEEYASIDTIVTDNTKASTNARMLLGVNVNSVRTNMVQLDGSNNEVDVIVPLNVTNNKIINLATPTANTDAATKAYVDVSGGASWSVYPATQNVSFGNFDISNVRNIRGASTAAGRVAFPAGLVDICGNAATLAIGQNLIYNRVTGTGSFPAGLSVNDPFTAGDANQTAYHFATLDTTQTSAIFTMCRKGAFTNMFGTQGTAANNTFVIASQLSATDFEFRRNVGITPAVLTGGTLLARIDRNGGFSIPLIATASTANILYFNTSTGAVTYAAAPTASAWSTFAATQNVNMAGFALTSAGGISNTSGTVAITGDDVNISCTGLTSILNIGSTLGTLMSSVGAIDITAGGTTAINSTGNVTIGSLGTTSIENFNLNNSVLTKVPATADLELNNISKIINTGGNIDISATNVNVENFSMNGSVLTKLTGAGDLQLNNVSRVFNNSAAIDISSSSVNVNKFQFANTTLTAPGTTRLFLDDIESINNDQVGGRIDITCTTVAANAFEFGGSVLSSGGANLELNNIGKLNNTTAGSFIDSYATLNAVGTGLTDAVGFKATTLSATSGTAVGFWSDATEAQASASIAAGAYLGGTTANNTNGEAKGLWVQTVLGGATSGTATGVEVGGSMTGATKRGFWEHSSSANVQNTFMNRVGIGADASSNFILDVSGIARVVNATASTTVPIMNVETTAGDAIAPYLGLYKNSSTPAVGDGLGVVSFIGNTSTGVKEQFARIRSAARNVTNGSITADLGLYVHRNNTDTRYMLIDGSDNEVEINPDRNIAGASFKIFDSAGVSTNNILMNADCSNANVMFKNYPQRYVYDIAGTYTLVMPAGFNVLRMLAYGAGGGGGSGRLAASSCFGGGAGGGGNGVELWFDRRELFPDASGSLTFSVTVGAGGAGGAAVTTSPNNGNNGSGGGLTEVRINSGSGYSLFYQLTGGNGGSGGTNAAGTGGGGATFSAGAFGSSGRAGASSDITAQPARNLATTIFLATIYTQTGGSGAGGGVNSAGTTAYPGGIYVSPIGQKFFNAQDVNTGGVAGTASNTVNATAGSITTFTGGGLGTAPAVRPLTGQADMYGGGGGSACGTPFSTGGGDGGGSTVGVAGGRGSGGGGGGGAVTVRSGAGGRGSDGFVYLTFW